MSVYLLDDDAAIGEAMCDAFQASGLMLWAFESPVRLLAEVSHDGPSCLILDLQLNGQTGLDCLNDRVFRKKIDMPVIVLTGAGSVPDVVAAMKLGAVDFLQKPVNVTLLIQKVQEALKLDAHRTSETKENKKILELADQISDREREVVALICEGLPSKQIAEKMGISMNTVANHRARLRQKTGAANTAELIRLVMLADVVRERKTA